MSIVRDLLEYYRLPPEVKGDIYNFSVNHTAANGSEIRFYYTDPKRMVIDMFDGGGVRYKRIYYFYDDNDRVSSISEESNNGGKVKDVTFTYGEEGVTAGALLGSVTITDREAEIVWNELPSSTGWPSYNI